MILIIVATHLFFAIVSSPSTTTFTDVLFSAFVFKTGSSIETWTGITSLGKNGTVEWTWNNKTSIKKTYVHRLIKKARFTVISPSNHVLAPPLLMRKLSDVIISIFVKVCICKIAKDESRSSVIVLRSEVFILFIELKLRSSAHAEIG